MKVLEELRDKLVNLEKEAFLKKLEEAINEGVDPGVIAFNIMQDAMVEIGRLFSEGEYFLADLLYAAEIFKDAMKILEPYLKEKYGERREKGVVVIGTVKGDIHDIGKNLVASLLKFRGFKVIDLGVDVAPEKFVEAVRKYKPRIVGLSALLTTVIDEAKKVITMLEEEGLRGKVKIVVGGAAFNLETALNIGADYYAKNAVEAVRIIEELAESGD